MRDHRGVTKLCMSPPKVAQVCMINLDFSSLPQKACYIAQNPQKEESMENEKGSYMLPDGSTIELGKARFRAPEVLFKPVIIGEECHGLHEVYYGGGVSREGARSLFWYPELQLFSVDC